jgi:anti-anti-sigma factor
MVADRVLFAIQNGTCFIKMVGEAKYSTTTGFDVFINDLIARAEVDNILVDLTDTTYIDSTSLGELTRLSSYMRQNHQRMPTLVSKRDNINAIIGGLGLDKVFVVVDEQASGVLHMQEIPRVELTERENALRILDAHRSLMAINDKTGRIFRSVVDAFEQELGGDDTQKPDPLAN